MANEDNLPANKPEGRPAAASDMAKLPPLQDRKEAVPDAPKDAPRDEVQNQQPKLTVTQQRDQDMRSFFADARKRMDAVRQEGERLQKQVREGQEMNLYLVSPADPQAEPFHLSNTPGDMIVAAPSPEYARRLARNEAGHDAWLDEDQVSVQEWRPKTPMLVTRNLRR
jgi:hypothetical protein